MLKTSKCEKIKQEIITGIKENLFRPGDKIKSECELAKEHKVNRSTAKRALDSLRQAGVLTGAAGIGTFISEDPFNQFGEDSKSSKTVMFTFLDWHDFKDSHHFQVFVGAEKEARKRNVNLVFRSFQNESEMVEFLSSASDSEKPDGIIFSTMHDHRLIKDCELPKVCYGYNPFFKNRFDAVSPDFHHAGYQIVDHLVKCGHKKIACLHMPGNFIFQELLEGYVRALIKAKINIDNDFLWVWSEKFDVLEKIEKHKPTAIFGCNDVVISGILADCANAGISVPHDISLAGFGDMDCSTLVSPKISTATYSSENLGATTLRVLMDRLCNPVAPFMKVIVPTELVIRESIAQIDSKSGV